jgi:hypothetical protein
LLRRIWKLGQPDAEIFKTGDRNVNGGEVDQDVAVRAAPLVVLINPAIEIEELVTLHGTII